MYPPRKSSVFSSLCSWYVGYSIKKRFSFYKHQQIELKDGEAVLLLANHFSWWDGFLMFQLNNLVFKRNFHVLVADEDYRNKWYLKYLGAFAANNKGKDVLDTLTYAGKLLDEPENLVLLFPQGKLYSNHVRSVAFEKGMMQLLNATKKKFQIVFSVTLTDFFEHKKPGMHTYLKSWEGEEYISLQLLKSEYNKHYENSLKIQCKPVV